MFLFAALTYTTDLDLEFFYVSKECRNMQVPSVYGFPPRHQLPPSLCIVTYSQLWCNGNEKLVDEGILWWGKPPFFSYRGCKLLESGKTFNVTLHYIDYIGNVIFFLSFYMKYFYLYITLVMMPKYIRCLTKLAFGSRMNNACGVGM